MFENAPWEFLMYFSTKSGVYEAARQWMVQIEQNVQFMVYMCVYYSHFKCSNTVECSVYGV